MADVDICHHCCGLKLQGGDGWRRPSTFNPHTFDFRCEHKNIDIRFLSSPCNENPTRHHFGAVIATHEWRCVM